MFDLILEKLRDKGIDLTKLKVSDIPHICFECFSLYPKWNIYWTNKNNKSTPKYTIVCYECLIVSSD